MDLLAPLKFKMPRSYSLTGPERAHAIEAGLAGADWYRTPVDRKVMKELMKRSDGPALRDTVIWLGLMVATAAGGLWFWGSWWAVPFFLVYGVLYASAADSRWHECGHGTAFKSAWMNDAVYEFASFLMMRNSVTWRWSHSRHHTDTIIVGRDPEISAMRPPQLILICLNFLGLVAVPQSLAALVRQALGRLSPDEADYVPESERPRAVRVARVHVAIYAGTVVCALVWQSWLPLVLIGLPRAYGIWLLLVMGLPQHMGLAEDVLDHRLNARTMIFGPVLRFIYWNMNYHVEHHMYPMVPYHALPRLHAAVRHDLPEPETLWGAWRQIIPTVLRQLKDPSHFIRKKLPPGAGQAREARLPPNRTRHALTEAMPFDAIEPEDVVRWDHAGATYALYRTEDDAVHATDGLCTHEQVHLADGLLMGHLIECPKHNGRFDIRDGSAKRAPVCVALRTYAARVDKGVIWVDLPG